MKTGFGESLLLVRLWSIIVLLELGEMRIWERNLLLWRHLEWFWNGSSVCSVALRVAESLCHSSVIEDVLLLIGCPTLWIKHLAKSRLGMTFETCRFLVVVGTRHARDRLSWQNSRTEQAYSESVIRTSDDEKRILVSPWRISWQ